MATKDDIITLPHNNLRTPSRRVGLITDEVKNVIDNMKAATIDWDDSRKHEVTVALAAVQIDVMMRIVIVRENTEDKENHQFVVFINPEITKYEGKITEDFEGCLSIKNIYGRVPRHSKVRVKAKNLKGKEFNMKLEGFLARIMQHEVDHTKGVMYVDRIKDNADAFFLMGADGKLTDLDYETDIKDNEELW